MKKFLSIILFLFPMLALADLTFKDPYVRAVAPKQHNSAAYVEITNDSDKAIEIIGVSSTVAKKAQLHKVVMKDGVAKMQHAEKIILAPNTTTSLAPGGLHIMLLGLKETLKPGQTVQLILQFNDGTSKTLEATVRDIRDHAQQEHHH